MASQVKPFHIEVPDEVLEDLRARLRRTRHAAACSGAGPWQAGVDPDYLRDLVGYWAGGFDWRAREAQLNALPQYTADLDGRRTHLVRLPGVRPAGVAAPPPLILCHGWPSSFLEMLPLAERLTDPGRFGADPAGAYDVVIPSLPGFLYSELPPDGPLTRPAIAEVLHRLMTEVLGYSRYGTFGGDIGGASTLWMANLHPEQVVGVHLIHPPFPSALDDLTAAEQAFVDAEAEYDESDGGYSAIMGTRPDTIAAALLDSPAGLAAWIVDKYRDWSDCHGDVETRFDRDTLCTILTLYWATGSIGTSFRQYHDWPHNPPRPAVDVPVAVTLTAEPGLAGFPRSLAERAATDIRQWTEPGKGGHFMALEEPDLLAADIRAFFGKLSGPAGI
ncbi:MAG: epoxide hydrolase family protein [Mycobacteriales bacterium]